ncbi:hypothetical protein PVK06_011845 [Gossypium arboreum]|uniref:RNase H type-1 domain-containing protein n=1 Tax=Gossypium arboreum TaxID=29729 RepID=A0ABR0QA16_GOSAR|nr:hypothetical protein PVK06_011845 [Gossypium arboreum]
MLSEKTSLGVGFCSSGWQMHSARSGSVGVSLTVTQAWNVGLRQIMLEMRNLELLKLLKTECDSLVLSGVIRAIMELLRRCWEVQLLHTYREGNCLADAMAATMLNKPIGPYAFPDLPETILQGLQDKEMQRMLPTLLTI